MISFNREFLRRTFNEKQEEVLIAICGKEPYEWSTVYREIVLEVGMKGSKNFVIQSAIDYVCYKIMCMLDPHSYFTKVTGRTIPYTRDIPFDFVNTSAVNEAQARHVFFELIQKALRLTIDPKTGDQWFARYAGMDLREGGWGDITRTVIEFPSQQPGWGTIRLMSFNSTKTAPEGTHMLFYIGDELSRAETKITYNEAKALYQLGLYNTGASFPNKVGKTIVFAYPNETDFDLTHELYEESFKKPNVFARRYATYELNPTITKEMLAYEFVDDPVTARRIRECIKPISKDNFYQPYTDKLDEIVRPDLHNKVQYKIVTKNRVVQGVTKVYTGIEFLGILGDNKVRCFAADQSKTRDRFVILGGYNETIDERQIAFFLEDERKVVNTNKRPVIDIMIVIEPAQSRPIDYLRMGEIYTALLKAFPNTVSWNSDHYQNEKLRQEVEAKGIRSETYNFSNPQQVMIYTKMRANVWVNNMAMCNDGHRIIKMGSNMLTLSELFVHEGKRLIKDGPKIDHPRDGSKDIQDSAAILVNDLMALETEGRLIADGIDSIPEPKLLEFAERYMIERQRLRNANVHEREHATRVAPILGLTVKQTEKLKIYVEEMYPNT